MKRIVVTLVLVMLMSLIAGEPARSAPGSAYGSNCLYVANPSPWARIEQAIDFADLVVVGQVVDEYPIRLGREMAWERIPDAGPVERYKVLEGRFRINVVLKGELADRQLLLPMLGDEWQCAGGPRVLVGTPVILFLYPTVHGSDGGALSAWQTGPTGSPMIFEDGRALLMDYEAFDYNTEKRTQFVGPSDHVLKRVAREAGATEEATKQALVAIDAPTDRSVVRFVPTAVVFAGLTGLLVALRFRSTN